ncbi:hypothetical protein HanRHA438_Chr17g0834641 [Helianthus annuus]|uniref:BYPASS-related protein n=1 Tax=Helianthus annuus TaxID=4232 RepID=A0A9K3DLM4_HELAN|nr:protein BPS1, chloroplastic-like [Helianthus annuus]KAF5757280.1 hypothetical protein HanXRQr2_Chr17g0824741 [Helianthus annuus]KAJ0449111.1 hypothetical protein HanHA89_Chr17g0724691 [Helianthus annuus]KAJ0637781.1 hypothetical protein HanOQP8_Chr17g0677791 [Helianthus annuus]KAJ0669251.1 hypothetical protein HanPI659440_Chr17g0698891 [Helianthus annuus]KAJ0828211.1 hypothetical protein HanRHA438_Chr17g0834641 [Helianthus annuus]
MFLVQKANLSSPFRSTTKKPPHIPKPYQLAAQLFDENIILHLKTLDLPPDSSYITLSWLSAAVSFISTVHSEAELQISNLKPEADDFHDLYMDYSLKVLDLCNLISSAVNRLTDTRLLLNFSLRLLKFSDDLPPVEKLNKAKDAIARSVNSLNNINNNINDTDESVKEKGIRVKKLINELAVLIGNLPRGKVTDGIRRMFYATGVLTVFVGSVLVTVLYGESDVVRQLRVPSEFVWADSVNGMENRIFDLIKFKKNVVKEVDDVVKQAVVVRDVIETVVNGGGDDGVRVCLQDGVKEMTVGAKKLSDGIDKLTDGVNGMFRTVLKIRNGRLDV